MAKELSNEEILSQTSSFTDFEKNELSEYSHYEIYFLRKPELDYPSNMTVDYFTDSHGYYVVVVGDHIMFRYEILSLVGSGSFGTVIKVFDHKENKVSAIKVERNGVGKTLYKELLFLNKLIKRFPDKGEHILQIDTHMTFRNHSFIVEELLQSDLETYLTSAPDGLAQDVVKDIIYSALKGLCLFYDIGLIHGDVKPGNIALSGTDNQVKIIDFGCSHMAVENKEASLFQTQSYRAPEVILRTVYGTAVDMWSLGCVTAELLLGQPLFYGIDEADQFCAIIEVLGLPQIHVPKLIRNRTIAKYMFKEDNTLNMGIYNRFFEKELPGSRTLEKIFDDIEPDLLDFIKRCLTWNPIDRIKPYEATKLSLFQSRT